MNSYIEFLQSGQLQSTVILMGIPQGTINDDVIPTTSVKIGHKSFPAYSNCREYITSVPSIQ